MFDGLDENRRAMLAQMLTGQQGQRGGQMTGRPQAQQAPMYGGGDVWASIVTQGLNALNTPAGAKAMAGLFGGQGASPAAATTAPNLVGANGRLAGPV